MARVVQGCAGGWNNLLKTGVAFDTRDFEPDPHSGIFADVTGEWSARAFGSIAGYVRLTAVARLYVQPLSLAPDLVLAVRLYFTVGPERFSLQIAPLVDAGRVFDRVALALAQWRPAYGAGLRIGWNQSTVMIFDFGVSREDVGFFIDFGMPF